ncbi:MAG: cob(I)yrinic acid a,c-diamide adenosyltransferase [Actinomycetota bacterium]|nr:cob(I)yrinic acid a,c-diamide adenosyltransferase [Actinomycetota bacterium]
MASLSKGYVQVYTGNGKGKTTAALGLAVRAAGNGMKVFIAQFIKGREYSEIKALERFSNNIHLRQYGRGCFIDRCPDARDVSLAGQGLKEIKLIMAQGQYHVIILDEINIAIHLKLVELQDVIGLIKDKPLETELILTGRFAPQALMKEADLVTEMKEIKHYYQQGILARAGIEK